MGEHRLKHALWVFVHSDSRPPQLSGIYMRLIWFSERRSPPQTQLVFTLRKAHRIIFLSMNSELEQWTSIINIYSWESIMDAADWAWPLGGVHRSLVNPCQKHQRQYEVQIWCICVCLWGCGGYSTSQRGEVVLSPHMGVFSSRWFGVEWSI